MSKTKTELNKMTKKNLLLHIEKMQLLIENDHLKTQEANREMQKVLARHKEGTPENKMESVRKGAGKLRYDIFHTKFSSDEDKKKVIKMVDKLIDAMV